MSDTLELVGRRAECADLARLVAAIEAGESRALVVHGEAGVGKSALLNYLAEQASNCRVVRAAGVQSDMELAFATLHQLCVPLFDHLERLPAPQRNSLQTAFGMTFGPTADLFLIGLAVLSLLSEGAADQPLLCMVDDQQWVDRASAQVLAFVARRLSAESVGLIFASRAPSGEIVSLPQLAVRGLPHADACILLDSVMSGPLDAVVRDQIVAETRGNPLALLELPRGLTAADVAGGFGLPGAARLSGKLEDNFAARIAAVPSQTRDLLQLAAAEPTGDPALLWRAATMLGIGGDAAAPAVDGDLVQLGSRVRFRHPLVRTAAYRSTPLPQRQRLHGVLAEVTDPVSDPDRRAWHLAAAAADADESIAAELERSADRARARGGMAAAAAFLERAAALTPDPVQRAGRALAAASAQFQSGAFHEAVAMLGVAEGGQLSELQHAHVDLVRAQLAFATSRGGEAPLLLLRAAKRLEPIDADAARETYLEAISAAAFAGRLASHGGSVVEVARAAATTPPSKRTPRAPDFLLDGMATNFAESYPAAVPNLRTAIATFGIDMTPTEELRWMWLITCAALHLWDARHWEALSARYLTLAREVGALTELPLALSTRAMMLLFAGNLTAANALIVEQQAVTDATGSNLAQYAGMYLAALRGRRAEVMALVDTTDTEARGRGEGIGISVAQWTKAVLHNGMADYPQAMAAAQQALYYQEYPELRYFGIANWAAAELVEAAARSGMLQTAADATSWLTESTSASGTEWALGIEARSRALLAEGTGDAAEHLYRKAVSHFAATSVQSQLARTHLLFGEWLHRVSRHTEARTELRTAHAMFEAMGMAAFAERARRELAATGEATRKRPLAAQGAELTPQEAQIARMARDGLSNPEIGTRLFISARTVQYHLGKVFTKLGITSRSQLDHALPLVAFAHG